MRVAYVDTSALVTVAFGQPRAEEVAAILDEMDQQVSANLLEAEVRAAFSREGRPYDDNLLTDVDWVYPAHPLSSEMAIALSRGHLRGADLWHVATAMLVTVKSGPTYFVTLDARQASVAALLDFAVLPEPAGN